MDEEVNTAHNKAPSPREKQMMRMASILVKEILQPNSWNDRVDIVEAISTIRMDFEALEREQEYIKTGVWPLKNRPKKVNL